MSKKSMTHEHCDHDHDHDEEFDFNEMSFEDDSMSEIMNNMLETSNNQMLIALELTKLIATNNPVKNMEDHVFSVYKKATKLVAENFPLKKLLEQIEQ
jgi:hypothetical protein